MEETEITDNKQTDKPWLFKPGQSGNPNGRPKGSLSVIGRIKQIFEENPEEFENFVRRYKDNEDNDKHLVEMIDGKPSQTFKGDIENPLQIIINRATNGDRSNQSA